MVSGVDVARVRSPFKLRNFNDDENKNLVKTIKRLK